MAEFVLPDRVRHVLYVGDTHCGSTFGLMPKECITESGEWRAEDHPAGKVLLKHWECMSGAWLKARVGSDPFALVLGGDLCEGKHHNTNEIITGNLGIQKDLAVESLRPVAKRAAFRFAIRGTRAHTGDEGGTDELVAKELGCQAVGAQASHYTLQLAFKSRPWVYWGTHHVGGSKSLAGLNTSITSAMNRKVHSCATHGKQPPNTFVYHHTHVFREVRVTGQPHDFIGVGCPSWKLKDSHVQKFDPESATEIGSVLITFDTSERIVHKYKVGVTGDAPVVLK